MEGLDYWRLCDELNVVQAALLVAGCDPSSDASYVEGWEPENRPPGYEAAKTALSNALFSGGIKGKVVPERSTTWSSFIEEQIEIDIQDSVDLFASRIQVASLKNWLSGRGITTGFFFPDGTSAPDYLDPQHPRYAPKLAAAVKAWRSIEGSALGGRSPKKTLIKWLREHAAEFGLSDEDGKPNETGIEETAKIANWQFSGGAPKTPDA